ncbi:SRP9-domain-containing protein [Linderina pennispora]|uniref:SRP9-domain-containing protein n=1 Tax=Linderina pennispora TaxID=61395 RepID=A0A1Y1WDG5_9FUNG|nr:SRP9-domain-containing protein [Linderina pennispora]ORX71204.1 SRP9-domain-containing protein [Linderina pennispora]
MTYYTDWESFETAASSLYASAPRQARYTVKYRNCDSQLMLKVTDDATCVQYRTERLDDIRRMARLHRILAQTASQRQQDIKELSPIVPVTQKQEEPLRELHGKSAQQGGKKRGRGKKRN